MFIYIFIHWNFPFWHFFASSRNPIELFFRSSGMLFVILYSLQIFIRIDFLTTCSVDGDRGWYVWGQDFGWCWQAKWRLACLGFSFPMAQLGVWLKKGRTEQINKCIRNNENSKSENNQTNLSLSRVASCKYGKGG